MKLVEIYVNVRPTSCFKDKLEIKIYKAEITKETEKQIKLDTRSFGHKYSTVLSKDLLNEVHKEEILETCVNSISRWIYVKEDENYKEDELKEQVKQSIIEEINNRRQLLNNMEDLIVALK